MRFNSYKFVSNRWFQHMGFLGLMKHDFAETSVDEVLRHLEIAIITRYAWEMYNDAISTQDTVIEGYLDRFEEKDEHGKVIGFYSEMKKVNDVLAIVEFFMNRFNSINDDEIGDEIDLIVVRYLKSVAPVSAELSPKAFKNNPLSVDFTDFGDDDYGFLSECKSLALGKKYDFNRMEDIYVGLNQVMPQAGGIYADLEQIYQGFWTKNGQWSKQITAKKRYLPLGEVIDYLVSKLQSIGKSGDHPFCYTI